MPRIRSDENDTFEPCLEIVIDNSSRVSTGKSLRPAYDVFGYAARTSGDCSGVRRRPFSASEGRTFSGFMDASIVFLYLHEMGHHVLGHVRSNVSSRALRREQEADADYWAIKTAWAARFNLLAALPAFILVAGAGGATTADEERSDHPLGVRRVHSMLSQVRELMKEKGEPESILTMLETLEEQVEGLLPEK